MFWCLATDKNNLILWVPPIKIMQQPIHEKQQRVSFHGFSTTNHSPLLMLTVIKNPKKKPCLTLPFTVPPSFSPSPLQPLPSLTSISAKTITNSYALSFFLTLPSPLLLHPLQYESIYSPLLSSPSSLQHIPTVSSCCYHL